MAKEKIIETYEGEVVEQEERSESTLTEVKTDRKAKTKKILAGVGIGALAFLVGCKVGRKKAENEFVDYYYDEVNNDTTNETDEVTEG